MLASLQKGRYVIDAIVRNSGEIYIYTAHNSKKQRFIVNEFRSLELINRWLPELSPFSQSGSLECFTENSCLYVITRYYDGDSAAAYFSFNKPANSVKLEMLKGFLFRLIALSEYPDIILCSMLTKESVCVYRGEICQNCYISPPEKSSFALLYELMDSFFTSEEARKNSYLGIIMQKLKNGLYENFLQLYLDWQRLDDKQRRENPIKEIVTGWWRRYGNYVKILASAAVIVVAVVVIYNSFVKTMGASDSKTYNPIDHIGTVSIEDSNSDFKEIHAISEVE